MDAAPSDGPHAPSLAEAPVEHDLLAFVPELAANEPNLTTCRRAAIASTLIAGLELARAGEIDASQPADFASITIGPLDQTTGQESGGLARLSQLDPDFRYFAPS